MKFITILPIIRRFCVQFKPVAMMNNGKYHLKEMIMINEIIQNSKNLEQAQKIVVKYLPKMNLINLNTTFKAILKFKKEITASDKNMHIFLESIMDRTLTMISLENFSELDARMTSNLYFYLNKIAENKNMYSGKNFFNPLLSKINEILEKKVIIFIDTMNDQETSNVIYTTAKLNNTQLLLQLSKEILMRIDKFSFKSNIIIFYSYTSLDLEVPFLYNILDKWFVKNIDLSKKINGFDFAQMVFSYSKITHIIPESEIFKYFNKAYTFFYDDINMIGVSTLINSLARFEQPIMTKDFYEKYQEKILSNLNGMSDRVLANILRGYGKWNYGTDSFYIKMEEKSIERCDFLDARNFSTILHSYASNFKGGLKFYKAFEKSFLERYMNSPSNLTNPDLLFIFYSFMHIREIFECSKEFNDFFKKIILERVESLSFDELSPIIAIYSSYFKDSLSFFQLVKKTLLEKKSKILKIKNIAEITKSFITHALLEFDNDLQGYLMKNLEELLEEGRIKHKNLDVINDFKFFIDLGKVLFFFLKKEQKSFYRDIYQKAADLLENTIKKKHEEAILLFKEDNILYYYKQSFRIMEIKYNFLKDF